MKKISIFMTLIFIVLSVFLPIRPKATVPVGSTNLSAPIRELSWTSGDAFPVINRCVLFPTLAPSVPPPAYSTHWYAGGVDPSSSNQYARTVYMSITIPSSAPRSDEFYYVLLSAWDSAGSYDQIGFSDYYGTWGLTYSWTSGPPTNPTYHYNPDVMSLSLGTTYTFNITTVSGVTYFVAYQGSTIVWTLYAPTGGYYLILSYAYSGYYDYTDYEEVWQTSTPGGALAFNFYFYNNYWVSTTGGGNAAAWTSFSTSATPSNVFVVINGSSVLVQNPGAVPVGDTMWVEPSSMTFTTANASVSTVFNVTIWLNISENVFEYQVGLHYNRTQLKAVAAGFTNLPTSEYMQGHATITGGPSIDTGLSGNGSVLAGETCQGTDYVAGPRIGSLLWVEFEILEAPSAGENLTSRIDISTEYSKETFVLDPKMNQVAFIPSDAVYTFIGPTGHRLADLRALVIQAMGNQDYFIYADPHRMTRAVATYDVASGSIIYGMCQNTQNQGFDTNPSWVSQGPSDRGRLLLSNKTVLMFGGPSPHWCVSYLEGQRLTPVYAQAVSSADGTHLEFVETSTGTVLVNRLASSIDLEHEDYFVIMTLVDANGNHVFISYGFDWKGTWAAGIYLKAIYPNIQTYANAYYIVHWVDTNTDGIPQPNEMTLIATG